MFRLPRSLGLQIAPTAETLFRAARPFTPRNILVGYPTQAVVSLRIQHEQLMRLDFHQQDCSLVGCSHFPRHALERPDFDVLDDSLARIHLDRDGTRELARLLEAQLEGMAG